MTVDTWYDPQNHVRYEKPQQSGDGEQTSDPAVMLAQMNHIRREREVKLAHKRMIEEKLQKCFLFHGVHSYRQNCRYLMEEYKHTKDELLGYKKDRRLYDGIWNSDKHSGYPLQREPTDIEVLEEQYDKL
ncbi:hypothetical protein MP228_009755 [Amoeboaphelidium protococcarum]|nr:hypothetical protein MP228_009755 [Amoeboaphelidium protococcarum]